MKKSLITILRDKTTSKEKFHEATDQLGLVLAVESDILLPKTTVTVDTPLARTQGEQFKHDIILIPILRSGLVLLHPFMRFHPNAKVGFIGARRNEKTAKAELYYSKLPEFGHEDPILILDPMIATGGSALLAIKILKEAGALENQIIMISFIASPEGIALIKKECPKVRIMVAQVDKKLDANKYIVPGLGDFGDRYFGTLSE